MFKALLSACVRYPLPDGRGWGRLGLRTEVVPAEPMPDGLLRIYA
jgi:hypothetical protein